METAAEHEVPPRHHSLLLGGCTPVPLAAYLKALGVLRVVAEQADDGARGHWQEDRFVLDSRLDREALARFLLDRYHPTPVLAPWNGGSGFHPGDNTSGIEPIRKGKAARLAPIRRAIATAETVLDALGLRGKPQQEEAKTALLAALRAEYPEDALDWLDAAVLIAEDRPRYPPLLGTGGNDGRLDFTNNFMQRLVDVIDPDRGAPTETSAAWLEEALFGEATPGLRAVSVGQFAPGDAGGPNQTAGFETKALVNPWDFVLMLEGALLFAAAATRRLEGAGGGALSYPFTVRVAASGSGATALADEGAARAEIWVPLWDRPAGLRELRTLLSEGRATLSRRPARDGLDFARAVSRLAMDRGITAFQRYAFLMRSGKAYFATPLNRIPARRNRAADLIDQLETSDWLQRFRRFARSSHAPHRVASLARRLEDGLFALATARQDADARVEGLLVLLGEIELHFARSPRAQDQCPPIPWLGRDWLAAVTQQGAAAEVEIAAALAALRAAEPSQTGRRDTEAMPMRAHLAGVSATRYPRWENSDSHLTAWIPGHLEESLTAVLHRRLLEAGRRELPDKPLRAARTAPLAAVAGWLEGRVDERRIAALAPGLMLVHIPHSYPAPAAREAPLPAVYRLLKPLFCTDEQLLRVGLLAPGQRLPLPAEIVRRLASGHVPEAMTHAARRLRAAGVRLRLPDLDAGATDGRRLLAVLIVPVPDHALRDLLPREATPEHAAQQEELTQ